jgi:hypothetical protein
MEILERLSRFPPLPLLRHLSDRHPKEILLLAFPFRLKASSLASLVAHRREQLAERGVPAQVGAAAVTREPATVTEKLH